MSIQSQNRNAEIIDRLVAESVTKLPKGEVKQVETFLRHYYLLVSPEDLVKQNILDLRGAALAHWHLARQRLPGMAKVHVYNPQFEKHGWQSNHTIVEIVTDDMPFLVDSVSMALNRYGLTIHLTIHPLVKVRRNSKGKLLEVLPLGISDDAMGESFMQFQVDRQTEPEVLEAVTADIEQVIDDVRKACADWPTMRERVLAIVCELDEKPPRLGGDEIAEAQAFCRWIEADHFTFLGYCEYDLAQTNGQQTLALMPDSQLGILRKTDEGTEMSHVSVLPTGTQEYTKPEQLLVVTKANARATIHRPAYMDFIGIKRFDKSGNVNGERCILGLFTSAAYNRATRDIPLLREKAKRIVERSGLPPSSHAGKALQNVIETYPRDALFQIGDDDLFNIAMGIVELQGRQRIRLFVRRDAYGRFYSCQIYVPRERYTRELRLRMERILMDVFNGKGVEHSTLLSESVLARVHLMVYTDPNSRVDYDVKDIERRLIEAARSWQDNLRDALTERCGEERGNTLFNSYADAFPVAYREDFAARTAAIDIERMEAIRGTEELGIWFYRPLVETEGGVRMKLFSSGKPISPSDALPLIENMGLKVVAERPYNIRPKDSDPNWIHEFNMVHAGGLGIDAEQVSQTFQDAFARIWRGEIENDGFNRLVLGAGLNWRDTVMLRAYSKYMLQIRIPFSQAYVVDALAQNPRIARLLVDLFHARLNPRPVKDGDHRAQRLVEQIEEQIDAVTSLDEDRILRSFLNVIQATLRTNYFQKTADGAVKPYMSFKFDPAQIERMPSPRPMFEIFVFSARTEAVHLRGGKVARGGLRWSDRREDFRTEVLGLMKAQMVKNAVIVPVGSKGGFVIKRPPVGGNREALQQEVIDCYSTFIRGMLDITDNLRGNKIVAPTDVVCYDDDDPYLVVAADKGTATFSDIANGTASEYAFWLGDAFASGGSVGYDHKKMGITARGAWESVKRHFRELGLDTQTEDFTVVGIGDMSGDVFGNGMLLSRHIKLVGAFNHLHIFLDPDPDPEVSYRERERLFKKTSSAWLDYNQELISTGGGVFERSAKSIPLSSEVQQLLGVKVDRMTPNELINALLKAPVDLLWNGGIGTYVKAETETQMDARDRANDAVRVNGRDLSCRVVGEGGNLGLTQLGRIEYARKGGKIYTDSIDNSGGVDTSDHEVNIKILLNAIVANGDMTRKQRDRLLADMTDEVADLVLGDNYGQSQSISMTALQAPALLQEQARFIRRLERRGKLDREGEYLPIHKAIADRLAAQEGLSSPEIAVLLAYSKMTVYEELLGSDVPEDPYLSNELPRHFPRRLGERFHKEMNSHRLRREIIATHITNSMVNRVGPTFAFRMRDETGTNSPDIARAYTAAHEIFHVQDLWAQIESLDNKISAQTQLKMFIETGGLIERATLWLLRNRRPPLDVASTVAFFQNGVHELAGSLPKPLAAANRLTLRQRLKHFVSEGVPQSLAAQVAGLFPLSSALDIVEVAKVAKRDVPFVASLYFALGARLELQWLREQIADLKVRNHWHTLAKSALRNDLHIQQRNLTAAVLQDSASTLRTKALVETWIAENEATVGHFVELMSDLKASDTVDFAMLSVAVSDVHNLLRVEKPVTETSASAA
ncbi:MAG: NAD-glutamate dehydrogenase [Acidiferrobacterales bacterium]